jgi:N-acylneuraminate cytidylyltransferase
MLEFARVREFKTIVLIQATSPLLIAEDLTRGLAEFNEPGIDSVLSAVQQKRFIWEKDANHRARPVNYDYRQRPRRQEFDGYWVENGAFYIIGREDLLRSQCRLTGQVGLVEMDEASYYEIDEPADWLIVESLLQRRQAQKRDAADAASRIRLVASDVDGVMTDAGMYYSEAGDELKKFNTRDGKGFELLQRAGIKTAIITSESTRMVERRAAKLKIDFLRQGVTDKVRCAEELAREAGISLDEICYIGDDLNDTELLKRVGFACCPADAIAENKIICNLITGKRGGEGVVREVVDHLLLMSK